ncbi:putative lim domain-containing protein [Erysiphe neolycopersici]|uniref:Putative lim domain-containing protein n=1 Tax=Erysiphe neolycopersici TaxID=212602 RepID=A0A420HUI7_9PEZI|nr:putative lim domain-containing protein [Erysiphe neolycopersici]
MLLRGRSRDRESASSHPGPVYMSNDEFGKKVLYVTHSYGTIFWFILLAGDHFSHTIAKYLKNLRNNRVERPRGARPLSLNTQAEDTSKEFSISGRESILTNSITSTPNATQRPNSAFSHRRAQSSLSTTYSTMRSRTARHTTQIKPENSQIPLLKPSEVVPSATYIERGQRWMEKEEAVALRQAMEDMDIDEESRIYAAAQKEASELVWQHKNSDLVEKSGQPYRYKNHLRKNSYQYARSESAGRYSGSSQATGLTRDIPETLRSTSRGSNSSEGLTAGSRVSSEATDSIGNYYKHPDLKIDDKNQNLTKSAKDNEPRSSMRRINKDTLKSANSPVTARRRNSGRRNVSGELVAGRFGGDQIWEEPEQDNTERGRSQVARDLPTPLHVKAKNPINRVQFAQGSELNPKISLPESIKTRSIFEKHKNPPSQVRNSRYIANHAPTGNSENESSKAQVSPIKIRDGLEIRSDEIRQATSMRLKDRSPKLPTPSMVSDKPGRPIVSFDPNWRPKKADLKPETRRSSFDQTKHGQGLPAASDQKTSSTPTSVNLCPDRKSSPKMSALEVNNTQTNNKKSSSRKPSPPSSISFSVPSIPSIVHSESPSISFTPPNLPVINIDKSSPRPARPLPIPTSSSKNFSNCTSFSESHWSPELRRRPTVICHSCQLPIHNRVLRVGTDEHFHPECFSCSTCGTGLESLEIFPEPSAIRAERIDRIGRRAKGEILPEIEGQTELDDGDERKRYYCHLDFHENFAPKCKHCKTPIIGEHIIALGEHWHYGHFFCAECGNPFEKDMTHIHIDGYAWCVNCQTKRTERRAPKCKKCQKAVVGEYVRALGGEWHENCFRCNVCDSSFNDGSFYPKQINPNKTIVLCTQCIERELKA